MLRKIFKLTVLVNDMHNSGIIYLCVVSAMLFLDPSASLVYSIKFDEKDYIITNFGMKAGNPFITVQGTAGGSYDPSMGDEGYEAYVFGTDKGIFQITVAEGSSNKPYYSANHILDKEIKLNECLLSEGTHGKPRFYNNTVEYIDHNQTFTKINKAFTIQVSADDPDEQCKTGEHIQKIYPSKTNATITQTSGTTTAVVDKCILLFVLAAIHGPCGISY